MVDLLYSDQLCAHSVLRGHGQRCRVQRGLLHAIVRDGVLRCTKLLWSNLGAPTLYQISENEHVNDGILLFCLLLLGFPR